MIGPLCPQLQRSFRFPIRRFFHFPCPKRADFPCIPSDRGALVWTAAGSSSGHANANKAAIHV